METIGIALAFVGAALAVGLACSGSARGVGSVGEVGAGVLAQLLDYYYMGESAGDPLDPRVCMDWWPGFLP